MNPFSEHNELSSVILKCGNSGSAIIPQGTTNVTVFPIICLTTSRLGNSCIKLNFTSNIVAINLIGTLTFQLYKLCENQLQATTVGPQWTFSRTAGVTDISTFSFSLCDCDICSSKECKYAVVMFPSSENTGNVLITNATLSAIAVDNSKVKLMNELVILECGSPNSTLLPGESINAITTTATVASVNLNASCLCNPCIRFEFASNIIIPTTTANATLTFQVFKYCSNQVQPIPVGTQWTFLTSVAPTGTTSDMFTFFVCDCNTCSDECCTYTVQVTATVLATGGDGATTTITINNATLSALAVDNTNKNC
jgi:hypothetical protein